MMLNTNVVTITPEYAANLLKSNTRNRALNNRHVMRLTRAMLRGEWVVNGDAIRIATDGTLLDGQHRLSAVIESGVTIEALVIDGLDPTVFDTIDAGKSRTSSDALSVKGVKHYTTVASASRLIIKLRNTGNPFHGTHDQDPTIKQVERFVEDNPSIVDTASRIIRTKWIRKHVSPGVASMCMFVFCNTDARKADEFFEKLDSGAGLDQWSPILLLRDRLVSEKTGKSRIGNHYKAALIFKAFRFFRDDATVKTLRVRTDGDNPEKNLFVL